MRVDIIGASPVLCADRLIRESTLAHRTPPLKG
jgi:hypothetical protein